LTLSSLEITLDSTDPEAAAAFWTAALGYRRLRVREPYIVCGPSSSADGRPVLLVQRVPTPSSGTKTPVHLDLRVADPKAEVERLVELGASVVTEVAEEQSVWTVLTDPQGLHFCVCPERPTGPDDGSSTP
jgi:predicted enzyme related to lactoylglutathione lyase